MRYPLIPILAATASVLSIVPAYAGPDDPLYKLLPNDGAAFKIFGSSVAISGNIVIVGAFGDSVNGTNSGAAYLFNVATGQQLFKLVPNDGAANDRFGISVAISGNIAIVGAALDDDNGSNTGSAYLFDTTTGLQIGAKLLASDGGPSSPPVTGELFGISVAISGTTAIVGANGHAHSGSNSGSAYVFDTTTGMQLFELLPVGAGRVLFGNSVGISGTTAIVGALWDVDGFAQTGSAFLFDTTTGLQIGAKLYADDGEDGDQFGIAVAISGTIAIIGANFDEDPVTNTEMGSAYLFDVTTGMQLFKLLPNDAQTGDTYGNAVAISGDIAIVGAHHDDDNGSNSGSAYLFDISTPTAPTQLRKLLPLDGAADDGLGLSVSIDGPPGSEIAIVGSRLDDDNGSLSGSAYLTAHDTDSDGLLDSWEDNGIPYIDGGGASHHFMLPGADPNHKDLYVEVDLDISQLFPPASQQMVVDAFANSPVTNPDLVNGVNLHILYDEDLISAAFFTTFTTGPQVGWAIEFDGLKAAHFGTPAERLVSDPASLLEAKARAYRYCIFADEIDDGSLGTAELPGNDLFLTLGEKSSPPNNIDIASTFMHEFGHTLGLGHGGGDHINGKPNYVSIMNYMFTSPYNFSSAFWTLDYSRFSLPTLDESSLDENDGVNPSNAFYANVFAAHGYDKPDGGGGFIRGGILVSLAPGLQLDWNQNGSFTDMTAMQDLNYLGGAAPFAGVSSPSFPQQLDGHDDWSNLEYGIGTSGDFADLTHTTVPQEKPSQAMTDWINANFPLPPIVCLADLNGDTLVNVTDLLAMLAAWGPNPGHAADINGDGTVTVIDLLAMLAAWGACP